MENHPPRGGRRRRRNHDRISRDGLAATVRPADLPRVEEIVPDARVLAAILFIALGRCCCWVAAGTRWHTDPALLLQRASARRARDGSRSLIVSLEIALAVMLLALTGLLTRSLIRLNAQPLGFDAAHLAAFRIVAPIGPSTRRVHISASSTA